MIDLAEDEAFFEYGTHKLRYKVRPTSGDRRHLVVVFTGIKANGQLYDFDGNASSGCKSAMLWIADDVDGINTYYMSHRGDRSLSEAVNALIQARLCALGLAQDQCTLVGFSKGASAALYYAFRYDYRNVVATVPQIQVGSFVRDVYPEIFRHMTATASLQDCVELNRMIPEALAADDALDKNIYLVSSTADEQFKFHIQPCIAELTKFKNFNMIMTSSDQVTRHGDVTYYNVPMILSVLYALIDGITPRWGLVSNGGGQPYDYPEVTGGAGSSRRSRSLGV